MILPGPIGEIIATLHFILNIIGQIAEEVYASRAFKFINADGICFGVIPIQRMFKSIAVVIKMCIRDSAHHAQGLLYLLLDGGTGQLLQLQPESNVVEHVEVGEERCV